MTDPDYLRRTRTGYDLTISTYAERFHHHLRDKPLDRAMISAFAGLIGLNGNRLVADVGCGTGATTGMFRDYGLFGGLCAWYSTIHVPDDALPQAFSEFHRVLIPGGFVLLAFQVGDQPRHLTEAFGQRVELTFYRRRPDAVAALVEQAGLKLHAQLVREPDDDGFESTPQAYLIARRR